MSDKLTREYAKAMVGVAGLRSAKDQEFMFYTELVKFALALNGEGRVNVNWLRSEGPRRRVYQAINGRNTGVYIAQVDLNSIMDTIAAVIEIETSEEVSR